LICHCHSMNVESKNECLLGELRLEHCLPAACIQQAVVIVQAHGRAGGVYRRTGAGAGY
jgi:hypothetical protein